MKKNKKKKNNRGFTLVELLAVIVILVALVSLALPSITSSLQRSKEKIKQQKIELLGALADQYLTEVESVKAYNCFKNGNCNNVKITNKDGNEEDFSGNLKLDYMLKKDYVDEDDLKDGDGKCLYDSSKNTGCESGCINYNLAKKQYEVKDCS